MAVVEELVARLGLDFEADPFKRAVEAIEGLKIGLAGVAGIAAAVGGALAAIAHSTAEAAIEAEKGAQKTGTTAAAFQELSFAAEQSEVSADTLQHSLVLLSRQAFNAAYGSKEAAFAFRQLGVGIYGANGQIKPTDEILGDLAERFRSMPDGIRKTALAQETFGRGGAELLPLLNKGRAGIADLRRAAYDYGVVLDEDVIQAAKRWEEQQKHLTAALKGLKFAIGGALLKTVGDLADRLADWIRANRELIATRLMDFLGGVKQLLEPLVKIVDALFIKTDAWRYSLYALGLILAFLNAPLLAIVGALFLIEDFYGFLEGKDSLIGRLFPKDALEKVRSFFEDVKGFLKYIFSGQLGEDIAAGGITKAVQGLAQAIGYKAGGGVNEVPGLIGGVPDLPSMAIPLVGPGQQAPGAVSNMHVTQHIHAAPGMDEKQIADQSAARIDDILQRANREAFAAVDQ